MKILTFSLCLFLAPSLSISQAALPDAVVQENMAQSPEIADIVVLRVDVLPSKDPLQQDVEIAAKVLGVQKTSTGLVPGKIIRISYSRPALDVPTRPGTFATSVPKVGQQLTAYLTQEKAVYKPTNGTYGFATKTPRP